MMIKVTVSEYEIQQAIKEYVAKSFPDKSVSKMTLIVSPIGTGGGPGVSRYTVTAECEVGEIPRYGCKD